MKEQIEKIRQEARDILASVPDVPALEKAQKAFLSRKGKVRKLTNGLKDLSPEERPEAGSLLNELRNELSRDFEAALEKAGNARKNREDPLDVTLPGRTPYSGTLHPITRVMDEMCGVFIRMGFEVAQGPEVELDWYNFTALNFPKDHPARDMQDTFFVSEEVVLRTHTSSLQIRTMENNPWPVRVIAPGKVYRCDSDITHTPMFHQVEGLVVDKGISFAHLKGTLTALVHQIFDDQVPLRFRPSFFPFTEPSAEVDIGCVMCRGEGCRVCSDTGWLEVLGAGMVHPAVLENVGYDPGEVTGFAFGLGVERIAMLKYGIDDIRRFYDNDLRFLDQF